ncbi:MAG: LPS assembly protein LptD [Candidatus Zixiibacteriota bacterium]
MKWVTGIITACVCLLLSLAALAAEKGKKQSVYFDNFNNLNMRTTDSGMVWYGSGDLKFRIDSTKIFADSVEWYRDFGIITFVGNVEAFDSAQHIWANKVTYYHTDSVMFAWGNVVLIQHQDSIRAEAQAVEYNRRDNAIYMENDPWLFLNYPDYKNLVKITGDYLFFYRDEQMGEGIGNVVIQHTDTKATCGCAEMYKEENRLFLMDEPVAVRDSSRIAGSYMNIVFSDDGVERINVFEEANAHFVEASDSSTGEYAGESSLTGNEITFYFTGDEVRKISAIGASRSEYFPAVDDTTGAGKNFVSGDSIFIFVENRKIVKAEVVGGAEGVYITERYGEATDKGDSSRVINENSPCDTCQAVLMTEEQFRDREEAADSAMSAETGGLMADSVAVLDSLMNLASRPVIADSILYRGRHLEFFAPERVIRITENANVKQKTVELNAHTVDYDIPNKIIIAHARIDSTDSVPAVTPLGLKDGGEEIFGTRLVFNVDTKQGLIDDAATLFEATHYKGDELYKEEERVFYVEDGVLIPCDKPNPNFHFHAKKMKVIQDDRVIARPVRLYIHKLPVAYIPYYVFPLQRGRHSGILPIKLGNFEKGNRFIGNLGYYWAASEYWDIEGALDFYENIGYTVNGLFRYNRRYAYSGQIRGTYAIENREYAFSEQHTKRWTISGSHSQTLPYDISFGASGSYVSDKNYYTDYSTDQNDRLNRNVTSKASFSKNFGWSSMTVNLQHVENLDTDSKTSSLPSIRFSPRSFYPFGRGETVDGKLQESWYNKISVSYSNSYLAYFYSKKNTDVDTLTYTDPMGETTSISDTTETTTKKRYQYLYHTGSVGFSFNMARYFTITPSVSFTEAWYYVTNTDQSRDAGIIGNRLYRRGSMSMNMSAKTELYGTFNINVLGLAALRHVLTPTFGFSYSPAVVKNQIVRKYVGVGGGGLRSMSLNMAVSNLIQAKIVRGETEKKLDLLRVNSSTSYNFEGIGRKFSNLSTSISSSAVPNVNINGQLSHSLYDENDELKWWSPTLESFTISSTIQARGSVADDYSRTSLESANRQAELVTDSTSAFPSPAIPGEQPARTSSTTNWNLNISHSYNEYYNDGNITSRSHFINLTFNVNLTQNWRLKYSQRYDFVEHETIDKIVDLNRSMNCWEGHFYWIPNGSRKGFYFKVYLIAIPDLKVEKSESGLRGALFNR